MPLLRITYFVLSAMRILYCLYYAMGFDNTKCVYVVLLYLLLQM